MSFVATFVGQSADICSYQIEEREGQKLVRSFTGKVPCTQRASSKGWKEHSDLRKVERWCELFHAKLPNEGGTVDMDLNEVAKD